jgi:hypothetical protein
MNSHVNIINKIDKTMQIEQNQEWILSLQRKK